MTSWIIRKKGTTKALFETFDERVVAVLNTTKYEAVPILNYLVEFNQAVKGSDGQPEGY